jgi:hypothetical protein
MTAVARRLHRLEGRFRVNQPQKVLRMVVVPAGAGDVGIGNAPCKRHFCGDGTVMELIVLNGPIEVAQETCG